MTVQNTTATGESESARQVHNEIDKGVRQNGNGGLATTIKSRFVHVAEWGE
jgi:hypothetical protein